MLKSEVANALRDIGELTTHMVLGKTLAFGGGRQVFINEYFADGTETPFGGNKMSGFGREKGLEAIKTYQRTKCITARP